MNIKTSSSSSSSRSRAWTLALALTSIALVHCAASDEQRNDTNDDESVVIGTTKQAMERDKNGNWICTPCPAQPDNPQPDLNCKLTEDTCDVNTGRACIYSCTYKRPVSASSSSSGTLPIGIVH